MLFLLTAIHPSHVLLSLGNFPSPAPDDETHSGYSQALILPEAGAAEAEEPTPREKAAVVPRPRHREQRSWEAAEAEQAAMVLGSLAAEAVGLENPCRNRAVAVVLGVVRERASVTAVEAVPDGSSRREVRWEELNRSSVVEALR